MRPLRTIKILRTGPAFKPFISLVEDDCFTESWWTNLFITHYLWFNVGKWWECVSWHSPIHRVRQKPWRFSKWNNSEVTPSYVKVITGKLSTCHFKCWKVRHSCLPPFLRHCFSLTRKFSITRRVICSGIAANSPFLLCFISAILLGLEMKTLLLRYPHKYSHRSQFNNYYTNYYQNELQLISSARWPNIILGQMQHSSSFDIVRSTRLQ